MLGTAIIVFREVLEAALIISIVMVATKGVAGRKRWVTGGVSLGILLAMVVAFFAGVIADAAEGIGQELFNATILIFAVLMLAWHNIWMASHAKELVARMKNVGAQVADGQIHIRALALVVCFAVLREGSEIVLFIYGMAASSGSAMQIMTGFFIGLSGGAILGTGLYFGLLKIPTRHVFKVTSWLILLLAAGLASEAAKYLVQADMLPALSVGPLWDSSWLLNDNGILGKTLHTIMGYTARPLGIQLLFYVTTITIIGGLMYRVSFAKPAVAALLLIGLGLVTTQTAKAADFVYSPIVNKGEFEMEVKARRDTGGKQVHKWELGYGFTDRWSTAVFLETEKMPGDNLIVEAVAWENIFQLTEQGEHWLDVGLYLEYEASLVDGGHDKFEGKILLEKQSGQFIHRANVIFEKQVFGVNPNAIELGYAWQSLYRHKRSLEFGVELYGEFGEIRDFSPAAAQSHSIGPIFTGVIQIKPMWNFKYQAGYQFGLSEGAPDGRLKGMMEIETYF